MDLSGAVRGAWLGTPSRSFQLTPSAPSRLTPSRGRSAAVTAWHSPASQQRGQQPLPVAKECTGKKKRTVVAAASKSTAPSAPGAESSGGLKPGALVEVKKEGAWDKSILALVEGPDGKKNFWCVDQTGRRFSVQPKQVSFVVPSSGAGRAYTAADLKEFQNAAAGADTGLISVAWELAVDDMEVMSLESIAGLLFDDGSPRNLYCTHHMLSADRLYFKVINKGLSVAYEPKAVDAVEAVKKELEAAARTQKDEEDFKAAVKASLAQEYRSAQPSEDEWMKGPHAQRIRAIKAMVIQSGAVSPGITSTALQSLKLLNLKGAALTDATELLVGLKVFREHEPLSLLRLSGDSSGAEHLPEMEEAARALLASPPLDLDADRRVDLTHLPVFTIDDSGTTEVDDGLSVELLSSDSDPTAIESYRFWIHVADPTRWLQMDDRLDTEARKRTRTLYMPWGNHPMFPRSLATGPFSLRDDRVSDALSVCVVLRSDGSASGEMKVVPTRVRVSTKTTYTEVDAILEDPSSADPSLQILYKASLLRKAHREFMGCVEIPLPEAKIMVPLSDLDVADGPEVDIKCCSQHESAGRALVAEMMILAGEVAGTLGMRAKLPLPYRGQATPKLPSRAEMANIPVGPCRAFALRKCMTRSTMTATPARHASLALDAYVQFTSPIRRYPDLIAHMNMKAHLRGSPPPFSARDIASIMLDSAESGKEATKVEREWENYWVAEYFNQRKQGGTWEALVMGWQKQSIGLAAILFEELGWQTVMKMDPRTSPGDRVLLSVLQAKPQEGLLRFSVVSSLSTASEASILSTASATSSVSLDSVTSTASSESVTSTLSSESVTSTLSSESTTSTVSSNSESGSESGSVAGAGAVSSEDASEVGSSESGVNSESGANGDVKG